MNGKLPSFPWSSSVTTSSSINPTIMRNPSEEGKIGISKTGPVAVQSKGDMASTPVSSKIGLRKNRSKADDHIKESITATDNSHKKSKSGATKDNPIIYNRKSSNIVSKMTTTTSTTTTNSFMGGGATVIVSSGRCRR